MKESWSRVTITKAKVFINDCLFMTQVRPRCEQAVFRQFIAGGCSARHVYIIINIMQVNGTEGSTHLNIYQPIGGVTLSEVC